MKRLTIALAAAGLIAAAAPAHAQFTLTILHTNDVHSRIEPINRFNSTCSAEDDAAGECFGGYARLATAVAAEREASVNPILVDGGDQFQGSLFYAFYRGRATAEMMDAVGYEVMTAGNHEFNHGPETLGAFARSVGFPVLLANAEYANEPELAGVLAPSVVIERFGERIGFIGLAPTDTDALSSPGPNVAFTDPVAATIREAEALTAAGVDKIIVLSHSGYSVDLRIAAEAPNIDVIVGGHSHTLLSNTDEDASGPYPTMVEGPDGTPTAIVQAFSYSKYLGYLTVTFEGAGVVTEATGAPILLDASFAPDPAIAARVAALGEPLQEIRNRVVAATTASIDGERTTCRARECAMGNLVAEAMLERVADQGVRIAIQNGGGLRASIDEGEITMGEVLTVLPFQNTLATFELSGADVIAALENGVSQVEEGAGRFPQVAGIRYAWSPSQPAGERIVSVEIADGDGFAPIDENARYLVVSNNFMRGGGDGYAVFRDNGANAYDFGPALEDVVVDYLVANGPYTPFLDGRIEER